jgi:hypothetical protein
VPLASECCAEPTRAGLVLINDQGSSRSPASSTSRG